SGHHSVRRNRPDDVAGYAIHIVKDALADNIPYKDMRITPEHCLYIDEKFIPARMLVNHHSIRYDYSKTEYTYYHLELEKHGVIKADGVLSESYLNTDNHKNFHNPEKVVQLRQETKDWAQDAAAPLETSREAVEPVHAHLKQRALHLGMKNMVAPETITHSTNLHIITDRGEVIHPQWPVTGNGNYVFVLPSPVHHVHIVSNSSRPCDAIGPFVDDRR
ncbi:Hint domain-containing protein, partial [Commensalibacter sp. M0402]|nr:Hint domain-containing protein [Commensalibacter melissae]